MSVVIIGGNECMDRKYCDLCKKYGYDYPVYTYSIPQDDTMCVGKYRR